MAISSFDIILFFLDEVRGNSRVIDACVGGRWHQRDRILGDWKLLRLTWEPIHKLMRDEDAKRVLHNMESKIEALGPRRFVRDFVLINNNEIEMKLSSRVDHKTLYDYYSKTIEWIEEIGEDVEHLLDSSGWSSCRLQSPSDVSFWLQFVSTLADIVDDTKWSEPIGAWRKELRLFGKYMGVVSSDLDFPAAAAAAGGDDVNVINDFVTRVASVIVRIAIHTLRQQINYRKTAGTTRREEMIKVTKSVLALQHEIHPTYPKFVDFHLHFLVALQKVGGVKPDFMSHCSNYVAAKVRFRDIPKIYSKTRSFFYIC